MGTPNFKILGPRGPKIIEVWGPEVIIFWGPLTLDEYWQIQVIIAERSEATNLDDGSPILS